jgi:hypothetical protein
MGKNVKRQFPKPSELAPLLQFSLPTLRRKKRRLEKAYTIWDLRDIAKRRTPKGPFDYTDGSAESEVSLERARQAYRDLEFIPSILKDVSTADLTRTALGETFSMPLGIAPTGFTRMMQTQGEIAGARAANLRAQELMAGVFGASYGKVFQTFIDAIQDTYRGYDGEFLRFLIEEVLYRYGQIMSEPWSESHKIAYNLQDIHSPGNAALLLTTLVNLIVPTRTNQQEFIRKETKSIKRVPKTGKLDKEKSEYTKYQ